MKKVTLALAVLVCVSSCASKSGTGTWIGAGAGGGLGAGIGAAVGGKEGAMIGAGVGAVAGGITGAAIGARMDNQQKELEKELKNAKVERTAQNEIKVKFDAGILFDTGKYNLKPASQEEISKFSNVLQQYPQTKLSIEGHTDNTGSKAFNTMLSQQRATSVKEQLMSGGVDAVRMTTYGLADDKPVASNATVDGRAQNRRVEIRIVDQGDPAPASDQAQKK